MKIKIFLVLCSILFPLFSNNVWADFTLDVIPEDNSGMLNLTSQSPIRSGEEVTFTAKVKATSDNEKYEVRQVILEPLQNDKGVRLDPGVVIFHTLRGSNSYGSLLCDDEVNLEGVETAIYSSSEQGDDDEFTIIYSVIGNRLNASGKFYGTIRYVIIPREGSSAGVEKILNVYMDAEKKDFDVKVITSSQSERKLELSSEEEGIGGYIKINLEGSSGKIYEIYQELTQSFKNDQEDILPLEKIKFSLYAKERDSNYRSFFPFEKGKLLVYSSNPAADNDEIIISFIIDKDELNDLVSGQFVALVEYQVKAEGIVERTIPIEIELEITPLFEIEIVSQDLEGGLFFRDLKPAEIAKQEVRKKGVVVRVKTNQRKPYVVIHKLDDPLTNAEGDIIPLEFFSFCQEKDEIVPGEVVFDSDTALKLGDMNVFISDSWGSAAEFKVIYSLKVTPKVKAGDYFTSLSFSLLEK